MPDSRNKRRRGPGAPALLSLLAAGLLVFSGCTRSGEKEHSSLGVDDGVEGFLFNFDQREEVADLVALQKKGRYPERVAWYYDPSGADLPEGREKQPEYSSKDQGRIRDIYYGLSNSITLGVASNQSPRVKYHISFTLPGGEECRFEFVTVNTIRLSSQNYVIESDGNLWSALTVTEDAEDIVTEYPKQSASELWPEALTESLPQEALTESTSEKSLTESVSESSEETPTEEPAERIR